MTDAKELAAGLREGIERLNRNKLYEGSGEVAWDRDDYDWHVALLREAAAALEAQAGLAEALAELELAADRVYHDLEHRISTASSYAVPVFDGVADLHDAIGHARAALARAAGGGE